MAAEYTCPNCLERPGVDYSDLGELFPELAPSLSRPTVLCDECLRRRVDDRVLDWMNMGLLEPNPDTPATLRVTAKGERWAAKTDVGHPFHPEHDLWCARLGLEP